MPLYANSISIKAAVACLFVIAFIGWFSELEPFTCCKRAFVVAIAVYISVKAAVHVINTIIINVLVKSRLEQQQGGMNGRRT